MLPTALPEHEYMRITSMLPPTNSMLNTVAISQLPFFENIEKLIPGTIERVDISLELANEIQIQISNSNSKYLFST